MKRLISILCMLTIVAGIIPFGMTATAKATYDFEEKTETLYALGIIDNVNLFLSELTVKFEDDKYVTYSFKEADELEHAYAVTVHKSQGSEYPAVVLPLLMGPRMLMNRNILYTAVTRAKKCICVVGDDRTFYEMVSNENEHKRYSSLKLRIREVSLSREE